MSLLVAIFTILLASAAPISGQVVTSCTASLITSFTPCLNFITGSTNGAGSPTAECCKSLASVVTTSTDCACLILTGNVPFGLPINRTLAISLPKACNSMSVPLQCRDTAMPLPAPGPIAFAPSLPPLPPTPPESSVQPESPPTSPLEPTVEPASPPISQGQKPLVLPSSAWKTAAHVSLVPACAVVLLVVGAMLV